MAGTIVSDTIQNGAGTSTSTSNVIAGCAKAWVNFNGTTAAIYSSYNVSSVTHTGTGTYTANFTTALANANYVITGSVGTSTTGVFGSTSSPKTTTTCQINITAFNVSSPYQYDFSGDISAAFFSS